MSVLFLQLVSAAPKKSSVADRKIFESIECWEISAGGTFPTTEIKSSHKNFFSKLSVMCLGKGNIKVSCYHHAVFVEICHRLYVAWHSP